MSVHFITVQWLPQTVKFISLTIIIARSGLTHTHTHTQTPQTHTHHKHIHTYITNTSYNENCWLLTGREYLTVRISSEGHSKIRTMIQEFENCLQYGQIITRKWGFNSNYLDFKYRYINIYSVPAIYPLMVGGGWPVSNNLSISPTVDILIDIFVSRLFLSFRWVSFKLCLL